MAIFSTGGTITEGTNNASGMTTGSHYWGSDSKNDYLGIFKTPMLTSSASAAGTSDFLTVYSSGHWGCQPAFDLYHITTYYRPSVIAWRCCMNYNTIHIEPLWEGCSNGTGTVGGFLIGQSQSGALPNIKIFNDAGNSTTLAHNSGNFSSDVYVNAVSSNGHSGQPVNKQNIGFETAGPYYQSYMLIKIRQGGGSQCYFSDSTVSNVDTDRASGGPGFHFRTIARDTNYHNDGNV